MTEGSKSSSPLWAQNPLSNFALALYSSPDVEETSIALQDRLGIKVNILLWCVWLETMDVELSIDSLNNALKNIESFDTRIVQVIRNSRREIKAKQTESLHYQVLHLLAKRLELLAEFKILDQLWRLTETTLPSVNPIQGKNVSLYLRTVGVASGGDEFISACQAANAL